MPSSNLSSSSSSWFLLCCSENSPSSLNLDHFLQCVTPHVVSHTLPKHCLNDVNPHWMPLGKDPIEYFTLEDLWESYRQWSAFGAATPVTFEDGDTVTQYFAPYLSAIQIYTKKNPTASRSRKEDGCGGEVESDSWSEDSKSDKLSRSLSNDSSKGWDVVSDGSSYDHEGAWIKDKLGHLYLHYTEMSSPYSRLPLVEQVNELARNFPGLKTFRSVDLSPASWIAVSWYPIYTVPARNNVKDLEACFLTFHTLSSSFQDCVMEENDDIGMNNDLHCSNKGEKCSKEKSSHVSLSPFGLAAYKVQGDLWFNPQDNENISNLHGAADSWLKQLNVQHHDFNFFTTHSCKSSETT